MMLTGVGAGWEGGGSAALALTVARLSQGSVPARPRRDEMLALLETSANCLALGQFW